MLRLHPQTRRRYFGTFPSNMLPRSLPSPGFLIVNLDPFPGSGSHWVAISKIDTETLCYFDSAGQPPPRGPIASFLNKQTGKAEYTNVQLQADSSNTCGMWSALFGLYHCCKNVPLGKFVKMFGTNLLQNECKLMGLFQKDFENYLVLQPTFKTRNFCQRSLSCYRRHGRSEACLQ